MDYEGEEKTLAYDLRQEYAKIVGEHLRDIAEARKRDDYYNYFEALDDLYTIVLHKFKKMKDKEKQYLEMKKEVTIVANKYPSVWTGNHKDANAHYEIDKTLKKIERFLYKEMDDANMFGGNWDDDGL